MWIKKGATRLLIFSLHYHRLTWFFSYKINFSEFLENLKCVGMIIGCIFYGRPKLDNVFDYHFQSPLPWVIWVEMVRTQYCKLTLLTSWSLNLMDSRLTDPSILLSSVKWGSILLGVIRWHYKLPRKCCKALGGHI